MAVADEIRRKLETALAPIRLDVEDQSHLHEGHGGWRPGGETHFQVVVVSDAFTGRSRVDRQRLVYGALREEMAGPVHALALKTLAPDEA